MLILPHVPQRPDESARKMRQAMREIYAPINLPQRHFTSRDLVLGLWSGILVTTSFSIVFGILPIAFACGFAFGFFGRYLARLRAAIARAPADTFLSNTMALAFDALLGGSAMAAVINPVAGLGIPLHRIVVASGLHALSKGAVRLWLDKIYSQRTSRTQRRGVAVTMTAGFLLGVTTSFVYVGSVAAVVVHAAIMTFALGAVYRAPLVRLWRRLTTDS